MMNGGNLYDLQMILGHSKGEMTQIYAHLSPDHLSRAIGVVSFTGHENNNGPSPIAPQLLSRVEEKGAFSTPRPNLMLVESV